MWCDLFVNVFQFLAETLLSDYLAKSGTGSQQCAHRHSFRKFNICPAKDLLRGVYYKSSIAYHQFDIRQLELFARQCNVAEGRGLDRNALGGLFGKEKQQQQKTVTESVR